MYIYMYIYKCRILRVHVHHTSPRMPNYVMYDIIFLCVVFQCQEATVEGTHPVTKQEAIQLEALQMQAQFGNQEEGRIDKSLVKSM